MLARNALQVYGRRKLAVARAIAAQVTSKMSYLPTPSQPSQPSTTGDDGGLPSLPSRAPSLMEIRRASKAAVGVPVKHQEVREQPSRIFYQWCIIDVVACVVTLLHPETRIQPCRAPLLTLSVAAAVIKVAHVDVQCHRHHHRWPPVSCI